MGNAKIAKLSFAYCDKLAEASMVFAKLGWAHDGAGLGFVQLNVE